MQNKTKLIYRLVMIIAALFGIIDVLSRLNLVPTLSVEDNEKISQQTERPIVVVIGQNQATEEKAVTENVTAPAPQKPTQDIPPKPVIETEEDRRVVEGFEFLELKDLYDKQISELAADVNDHLTRNANYRNADRLLERAQGLTNDIRETYDNLQKTKFKNELWKNQLIKVVATEITRVDGIREGIQSSYNGGSWKAGFERGHKGKIQFDSENGALTNMYVKLVNTNSAR